MPLGLIQFAVEGVGHILAAWLAVGRHPPVCAYRGLIALQRKHGGANAVILGRRNALLLLGLEQFGVELVAVRIVHFAVGLLAVAGLLLNLIEILGVLNEGQRPIRLHLFLNAHPAASAA